MIIKDTTNLKVGDYIKIKNKIKEDCYYYKVEKINCLFIAEVKAISHEYTGPMDIGHIPKDYITSIMTEEEVTQYLLEL